MRPDYLRLMSLTQTNRSTRRTHTVIRSELEGVCLSRRAWLPASEPYVECVCVCVTVSVCECSFVVCVRQIHHHIYAPVFCVILHLIFLQYFSVFFCAAAVCQQRAVPKFYCMGIFFFFSCMQRWKTDELVPVSLSWFSRPCKKPDGSTSVISF